MVKLCVCVLCMRVCVGICVCLCVCVQEHGLWMFGDVCMGMWICVSHEFCLLSYSQITLNLPGVLCWDSSASGMKEQPACISLMKSTDGK